MAQNAMLVKKNKKTLNLTFPKPIPHKDTPISTQSRVVIPHPEYFKNHDWDIPGTHPVHNLIAARRDLVATTEALIERKKWAKGEHLVLEAQWKDIRERELNFRKNFTELSSFIRRNKEKRERSEKVLKDQRKLRMEWAEKVDMMRKQIDTMIESKNGIDANAEQLGMYKSYLNKVVNAAPEFKNADALISRYEALIHIKVSLALQQEEISGELESIYAQIAKIVEENTLKILGLHNTLAKLIKLHNTATTEARRWEYFVLNIKKHFREKYRDLNQVKQSCQNTYYLMCKRKYEEPKIAEDDFEQQLMFIKKCMQDLVKYRETIKVQNEPKVEEKPKRSKKQTMTVL